MSRAVVSTYSSVTSLLVVTSDWTSTASSRSSSIVSSSESAGTRTDTKPECLVLRSEETTQPPILSAQPAHIVDGPRNVIDHQGHVGGAHDDPTLGDLRSLPVGRVIGSELALGLLFGIEIGIGKGRGRGLWSD